VKLKVPPLKTVYSAPYSVKRNYEKIERRLDSSVPTFDEETLVYATLKPRLDDRLSSTCNVKTIEDLCEYDHIEHNEPGNKNNTLTFKERQNLKLNEMQRCKSKTGQGSIFKRMGQVRQQVREQRE
jgi:hypothetical protein